MLFCIIDAAELHTEISKCALTIACFFSFSVKEDVFGWDY